ncbi:hypothetical protein CRG98_032828 [Punica granatum]|uniref:Uncharacterized protein n=1 Tax=Punica granatum TaxID=22663 RepID=A0A2I0IS02_PUNGR|nr:hypothetical protein CRG98_032828 [Punica granatum]
MTNDTSGRVSGTSLVSRDTPNLSRTPFRTGLPGPNPLTRFLTTLTLRREEVVTIRGPIHRAQPPFHSFSLTGFFVFISNFLSLFRVHPGFGTFGTTHGRLDPSLRSPTSLISHRAVAGASVPTHFLRSCRGCPSLGSFTRNLQTESWDSHGRFPDSFPRASRLGNIPLRLREVKIPNVHCYEVLNVIYDRNA